MLILKQSTASQAVLLGPFVDDTDGATAETGLTIANTDIRLSANGGNMFAKTSGGGTHDENGWYTITLDATDTATVGRLQISCKVAGALAVFMEAQVLEEAIYDALFAASAAGFDANQRVDVGKWLGTAVTTSSTTSKPEVDVNSISDDATAANNAELAFDGTGFGFTGCTMPTVTTLTGHTAQTGDTYALANGAAGFVAIDTVVDAIKVKTDFLPSATAGAAGGVFIAGTNAATVVTTSLTTTFTGNLTGSVGSVTGAVGSVTGSVGSIANAPTNWSSMVISAGGAVDSLAQGFLNTLITETNAGDVAESFAFFFDVDPVTTQTVNDVGAGAGGSFWSSGEQNQIRQALGMTGTTAATTGTGNLDIVQTDTTTDIPALIATAQADLDILTGSDGVTLATAQGNYAPATAAAMTTAQNDLDILTGSDGATLATAQANYAPATAAAMTTAQNDLDILTGSDGVTLATAQANYAPATAASVAALNDISAADVNAQVLDVLNTDTFAQPGQATPAATTTIVSMLGYLYKSWRNKSDNDGSTVQLYNDDASTVDQKRTVSESGGTVTQDEFTTGP